MSKYVCHNEACERCGVVDEYQKDHYKWDAVAQDFVSENRICPCCGAIREEIVDDTPLEEKNIGFGKFSSSSPEQQAEMLKKRSHDHFEKHIKPEKEHRLHEAVKQFQEASKK